MSKIPIKKRANLLNTKLAEQIKTDLRNSFDKEKKSPKKQTWFLLLNLLILLVVLGSIAWFFLCFQRLPFSQIVPNEAVVFSVLNYQELFEEISPFTEFLQEHHFYGYSAAARINRYFEKAGVDFQQDFQMIFEKQAGFILMPSNSDTSFPFVLLFKKASSDKDVYEHFLEAARTSLEKDYSVFISDYRQVQIVGLDFLRAKEPGVPDSYFYAEIEDYLLISNCQKSLKQIVDMIIDK